MSRTCPIFGATATIASAAQAHRGRLLKVLAAATSALFSAAACAVDAVGYARIGTGDAANPHRTCYNLGISGGHYRLGNECDIYGELGLAHAATVEGVRYRGLVMANYHRPANDGSDARASLNQLFARRPRLARRARRRLLARPALLRPRRCAHPGHPLRAHGRRGPGRTWHHVGCCQGGHRLLQTRCRLGRAARSANLVAAGAPRQHRCHRHCARRIRPAARDRYVHAWPRRTCQRRKRHAGRCARRAARSAAARHRRRAQGVAAIRARVCGTGCQLRHDDRQPCRRAVARGGKPDLAIGRIRRTSRRLVRAARRRSATRHRHALCRAVDRCSCVVRRVAAGQADGRSRPHGKAARR